MAIKISSIVSMLLLCGCLFVFPPALSIRCYRMVCEGEWCFGDVGEVDCEGEDDDRCGTLTFTTDGSTHNVIKNCTRSTQDCNQASTCERVADAIAGWGLAFSDCSMTCCEGDVCNAPEEELKLEEEDDHVVEGPITSVSIHSEKKAIKAYHMTLGKKKGPQLKLHGKKKDFASVKSTKEKLPKLVSSFRF
ncbi:uncharacterized protein LOC144641310 [Oculina patagonica]